MLAIDSQRILPGYTYGDIYIYIYIFVCIYKDGLTDRQAHRQTEIQVKIIHIIMHNWNRHQDAYIVDKCCTKFEFTIPSVYSTYTHNIQNTIDIRMPTWFTSNAHCSISLHLVYIPRYTYTSANTQTTTDQDVYLVHEWCILFKPNIPGVCSHKHTTLHTNYYRHEALCMVHKWCTQFEFTIPSAYSTNAHTYFSTHYTHHDSCIIHNWCRLFDSNIPGVYSSIHTHIT